MSSIPTLEALEKYSRKRLQAEAKKHGIKANIKSTDIIIQLLALRPRESSSQDEVDPSNEAGPSTLPTENRAGPSTKRKAVNDLSQATTIEPAPRTRHAMRTRRGNRVGDEPYALPATPFQEDDAQLDVHPGQASPLSLRPVGTVITPTSHPDVLEIPLPPAEESVSAAPMPSYPRRRRLAISDLLSDGPSPWLSKRRAADDAETGYDGSAAGPSRLQEGSSGSQREGPPAKRPKLEEGLEDEEAVIDERFGEGRERGNVESGLRYPPSPARNLPNLVGPVGPIPIYPPVLPWRRESPEVGQAMQPWSLNPPETFMGVFSRPEAGWEPRLLPETGFLPFDVPVFHPPVFTRELQPQVQQQPIAGPSRIRSVRPPSQGRPSTSPRVLRSAHRGSPRPSGTGSEQGHQHYGAQVHHEDRDPFAPSTPSGSSESYHPHSVTSQELEQARARIEGRVAEWRVEARQEDDDTLQSWEYGSGRGRSIAIVDFIRPVSDDSLPGSPAPVRQERREPPLPDYEDSEDENARQVAAAVDNRADQQRRPLGDLWVEPAYLDTVGPDPYDQLPQLEMDNTAPTHPDEEYNQEILDDARAQRSEILDERRSTMVELQRLIQAYSERMSELQREVGRIHRMEDFLEGRGYGGLSENGVQGFSDEEVEDWECRHDLVKTWFERLKRDVSTGDARLLNALDRFQSDAGLL